MSKKRTSLVDMLSDLILEDFRGIKDYLIRDLKKRAVEDIHELIDVIFKVEQKSSSSTTKVSYQNYYKKGSKSRYSERSSIRRYDAYNDPIEIHVSRKSEAENILEYMYSIIQEYKIASLAQFYEYVGYYDDHKVERNYTDNNYGWINIDRAEVIKAHEGYILRMPRLKAINEID